ncbi:MAG: PRC-barrel domain-containing protein [Pseudomonadota bacterium]
MTLNSDTMGRVATEEIRGADVYDTEGSHVGIIHDLLIEGRTGHVSAAILTIGSILGMGGEHQEVPWSSLAYDVTQRGFVLGIPLTQMTKAPEEEEDAPLIAPATGLT